MTYQAIVLPLIHDQKLDLLSSATSRHRSPVLVFVASGRYMRHIASSTFSLRKSKVFIRIVEPHGCSFLLRLDPTVFPERIWSQQAHVVHRYEF
ncbi:hypothetical protein CPB86DRAFT_309132 [Serendipita vermifera]|nr:hypothetical protein CPB86DRAFT_309132 [Serendipita vermifera]